MYSKFFQKTDRVFAQNFLKGETVDKKELGIDSGSEEGSDVTEHVYIVFNEGTDIETGIAVIEQQVLLGNSLEVTRKDTTGNAIVAVVESSVRREIENLSVVSKVKINEAAEIKKNRDGDEATEETTTEATEITETAETDEAAEVGEDSSTPESSDESSFEDPAEEKAAEDVQPEVTAQAIESNSIVGTLNNEGTVSSKSVNSFIITAVIVVVILAAAIVAIAKGFRKKR